MNAKAANAAMWTMLGCTYGVIGEPWLATLAFLVMASCERAFYEIR